MTAFLYSTPEFFSTEFFSGLPTPKRLKRRNPIIKKFLVDVSKSSSRNNALRQSYILKFDRASSPLPYPLRYPLPPSPIRPLAITSPTLPGIFLSSSLPFESRACDHVKKFESCSLNGTGYDFSWSKFFLLRRGYDFYSLESLGPNISLSYVKRSLGEFGAYGYRPSCQYRPKLLFLHSPSLPGNVSPVPYPLRYEPGSALSLEQMIFLRLVHQIVCISRFFGPLSVKLLRRLETQLEFSSYRNFLSPGFNSSLSYPLDRQHLESLNSMFFTYMSFFKRLRVEFGFSNFFESRISFSNFQFFLNFFKERIRPHYQLAKLSRFFPRPSRRRLSFRSPSLYSNLYASIYRHSHYRSLTVKYLLHQATFGKKRKFNGRFVSYYSQEDTIRLWEYNWVRNRFRPRSYWTGIKRFHKPNLFFFLVFFDLLAHGLALSESYSFGTWSRLDRFVTIYSRQVLVDAQELFSSDRKESEEEETVSWSNPLDTVDYRTMPSLLLRKK